MSELFFKEQELQKKSSAVSDGFLAKYQNISILITGAGGSIGSKIVEELTNINCKNIILLDQSELNLFHIKKKNSSSNFIYELADIRDSRRIDAIIQLYQPKLVIHTAAYKHVSLVENDAYELIRTNVEGTINVFNASKKQGVSEFIFISTDKAVNPVNTMGLSKMLAEIFIKTHFKDKNINTKIIRFGNVIHSNGSVLPTFIDHIHNGTPIEVRGVEVERYFIYDTVVARSILNIALEPTNSMYLLEMNAPIKIIDVANHLKKKYQSTVPVKITNLCENEKVTEELLHLDETIEKTNNPTYYRIKRATIINYEIRNEIIDIVARNKKGYTTLVANKISLLQNKIF
jgi:FlaA1/EpsC-like NDP-sugar epimerase